MARVNCRGCGSSTLIQFLDLGEMPLAGGFLPNREAFANEKVYPLKIFVCGECGLVQILEVIDPDILFQDYSFSSSTIEPLVRHFEAYARWLKEKFSPVLVVEFGCNDGILLAPLEELGIRACGIDISVNITAMARDRGLSVLTGAFDEKAALEIAARFGRADIVTGSNAFAHNDHPEIILQAARKILKPSGHFCVEVMYAGDLLEMLQWDTLYHEHLTFYCLTTLAVLLKRHGFHVTDAERIPMHGGSLRVSASMNPNDAVSARAIALFADEERRGLARPETWVNFGNHIGRKIEVVRSTLEKLSATCSIWGYGAAGKATMWVNACAMRYLKGMVDASPLRAGRFMPGTHTPIVFPEELRKDPPDYIFVTAWNYADMIRSKEEWFKGVWITPLPDLRFF